MSRRVVHGTDRVLARINAEMMMIKKRSRAGLWEAGLEVQRESQLMTPHDTGNLKGSAYTTPPEDGPNGPGVEIGYEAAYAPFVHEIDANYRVGQWKFLETALNNMQRRITKIIQRAMG
jgi:hypothetical protein